MSDGHAYHSALRPPLTRRWPDAKQWIDFGSAAYQHDITHGLHPDMARCDILYTDLPWKAGFAKFDERAGVPVMQRLNFHSFMDTVDRTVATAGIPAVIVTGKNGAKRLPRAGQFVEVKLNGAAAIAAIYHGPLKVELIPQSDTREVLVALAEHYYSVGDFCCGYGRAGRIFAQAGRCFVMTDYNAECIGYVAQQAPGWFA